MNDSDRPDHLPARGQPPGTDEGETHVRDISIQQSIHQIQLLLPSLVEAVGRLAENQPELAHKILDDVIAQGEHRQGLEEVVVRGDDRRSTRAQVLSWIFAMTALVGSLVLIRAGQSAAGIVIVVTALAPLVGVNVLGRRAAQRERAAKSELARRAPGDESAKG